MRPGLTGRPFELQRISSYNWHHLPLQIPSTSMPIRPDLLNSTPCPRIHRPLTIPHPHIRFHPSFVPSWPASCTCEPPTAQALFWRCAAGGSQAAPAEEAGQDGKKRAETRRWTRRCQRRANDGARRRLCAMSSRSFSSELTRSGDGRLVQSVAVEDGTRSGARPAFEGSRECRRFREADEVGCRRPRFGVRSDSARRGDGAAGPARTRTSHLQRGVVCTASGD